MSEADEGLYAAPRDPAWRVLVLIQSAAWGGLAWLIIGGLAILISPSAAPMLLGAGALASLAHAMSCRAASRTIERALCEGTWRVEQSMSEGPTRWIRGAWLRVIERSGRVVVFGVLGAIALFLGGAFTFLMVVITITTLAEGKALADTLLAGGLFGAMAFFSLVVASALAILAARSVSHASQDRQLIRHVAAARAAQGGELSAPVEATAGELSMVLAEQRGGLEVHEVALDARDEAAVVLDLDAAEGASAPAEAHHIA